jgi:hypothetical protein
MSKARNTEQVWFSIPDAALYAGFSVSSIRKALALGLVPKKTVPLGGQKSVRIKREHLDAWIQGTPINEEAA